MSTPTVSTNTVTSLIRQFGIELPDRDYTLRPSAYVIVRDPDARVAIVRTPLGSFLPGGGLLAHEAPEQAAVREVVEECGLKVEIIEKLGDADQFVYAEAEATHLRKRSTFFRARVTGLAAATESDHALVWLTSEVARRELSHESHRWALAEEETSCT